MPENREPYDDKDNQYRNAVVKRLRIETPEGRQQIHAPWVVRDNAADFDTAGFEDPAATVELLNGLATARDRASVADAGRKCLDNLMPQLLQVVSQQERPTLTLQRVVPILRAVLRRSAYLVLLQENPRVLEHFVRLAGLSRWLAEELARQPMFLNVLVDQHAWEPVPDRETLSAELAERIAIQSGEPASEEMLLDELRTFKEQHVFRVAAAELRDTLPLMHVSDYLTHLAEAVLQHALGFAWDQVAAQHPEFHQPRPFIVVGYGKLGGIELGPGSDLDLVFLHDLPTSASLFLHRLVRKLLHVLTVPTYLGPLYKVDMRLRPSGNSGTLVSSLSAFRKYQEKQAWVWEHQALVRARVVAGDAQLARAFASLRHEILCQPRSRDELRAEVRSMRRRMAQHHGQELDLKRGAGGIVDIEFIVQYLVLAWADEHPSLATHSDNVRILEVAGSVGALSEQDAARLTSAYLALRGEWHRSVLDSTDVVIGTVIVLIWNLYWVVYTPETGLIESFATHIETSEGTIQSVADTLEDIKALIKDVQTGQDEDRQRDLTMRGMGAQGSFGGTQAYVRVNADSDASIYKDGDRIKITKLGENGRPSEEFVVRGEWTHPDSEVLVSFSTEACKILEVNGIVKVQLEPAAK